MAVIGFALWFAHPQRLFRGASAPSPADSAAASNHPSATQSLPATKNESAPSAQQADNDATTFIALRYDKTHVVFHPGEASEFSLEQNQDKTLHRLPDATSQYVTASTFAIDSELLASQRNKFDAAHLGEQWQLELCEDSHIPATISKPVAFKWGCDDSSYAAAFLAEIAPEKQPVFGSKKDYFLIHKSPDAFSSKPGRVHIGPLPA
jgi:hypothetical protein